jgi:hypothetical protein
MYFSMPQTMQTTPGIAEMKETPKRLNFKTIRMTWVIFPKTRELQVILQETRE